jgi:hypothetical protein
MQSFISFLIESIEGKPKADVRGGRTEKGSYRYVFPAPGGKVGDIWIDHPNRSKTADVSFTLDGEHSGKGTAEDSVEILNAVVKAVQDHSKKRKFDKISYYTSSPKKARIFDKIIGRMGKTPARRKANIML